GTVGDLTWRMLRSLYVVELRLEGDAAAGRTALVQRLTPLAGSPARADDLRRHLNELSDGFARTAATVNRAVLVRELAARSFHVGGPSRPGAPVVQANTGGVNIANSGNINGNVTVYLPPDV